MKISNKITTTNVWEKGVGDEVLELPILLESYKMRQVQCKVVGNERTHTIITFVTQQQPG